MIKLTTLFLAVALMFAITFVGAAISSNGSLSAKAQVTEKRKRHHTVVGTTKSIVHKTKRGTKHVYHRTKRGTKFVYGKTKRGTKHTYHKSKRITKRIFHKTKRVIS